MITKEIYYNEESFAHIPTIRAFYDNLEGGSTADEEFKEFLEGGYLYVIRENDILVGYVILSLEVPKLGNDFFDPKTDAYLFHLYLSVDARNKGLGTELIHHCEELARKHGRKRFFVETHFANSGMKTLLERLGYTFIEKRDYTEQYNDADCFYLLYEKHL